MVRNSYLMGKPICILRIVKEGGSLAKGGRFEKCDQVVCAICDLDAVARRTFPSVPLRTARDYRLPGIHRPEKADAHFKGNRQGSVTVAREGEGNIGERKDYSPVAAPGSVQMFILYSHGHR